MEGDILIDLVDNDNAPIANDILFALIKQNINCGSFHIQLNISGEKHKQLTADVSLI